jgi:predicted transcriptional regulator
MGGDDHMKSNELMFELSHPERLKMLQMLLKDPMRLSQISSKLEVTTAEVSRHLERLTKARLIERESDNYYHVTAFAKVILSEYLNFEFLTENTEFFINHDIAQLPEHLHWFHSMSKADFIEGTLEVSSMIKDLSVRAKNYIYVISEEIMRGVVELDCNKNDAGVKIRKIYPKGAEFPKEYTDRLGDTFEIKTLDSIALGFKMNEKTAGLVLRDMKGKMDYSKGFIGEDKTYRLWTEAIFEYYWKKAKPLLH